MATATNGQTSIVGTATGTYTFADRFGYVLVTNTGTSPIYVTGDGSAPETTGEGTAVIVLPGSQQLVANGLPIWHQSQRVIPAGSNANGTGAVTQANPSTPQEPGNVTPMAAMQGQMANPGTTIIIAGTVTGFVLQGAG
jgi:hypothetical protein